MHISLRKLDGELPTPTRAHEGDAGLDLMSTETFVLGVGERRSVPAGVAVAIPAGCAGLVLPRSGLASRHGIGVVNSPGLIDSGYRGEIEVLLVNHGEQPVEIGRGDRIAQLIVTPVMVAEVVVVDELDPSERGEGGFGSSGV